MIVLSRKKFFLQYRKVEKVYCNSLFKGFGYINEAFVYVSKGFGYISETFGYRFSGRKNYFCRLSGKLFPAGKKTIERRRVKPI